MTFFFYVWFYRLFWNFFSALTSSFYVVLCIDVWLTYPLALGYCKLSINMVINCFSVAWRLSTMSLLWPGAPKPLTCSRVNGTLKSQFLLINFYCVLPHSHINRALFSLVFPTCVLFSTQIVALKFFSFLASIFFSPPRKVGPHAQQQSVRRFISHQQAINLNDQQKLQFTPKSFNFHIIIKQPRYCLIGLCSNIIYVIFVFKI